MLYKNLINRIEIEMKKTGCFFLFFILLHSNLISKTPIYITIENRVSLDRCKSKLIDLNFKYNETITNHIPTTIYESKILLKNEKFTKSNFLFKQNYSDILKNIDDYLWNLQSIKLVNVLNRDNLIFKNDARSFVNKKAPMNNPPKHNNNQIFSIKYTTGWIEKFSVLPIDQINFKPQYDIKYYWYNEDNNSIENTIGDWGGPLLNGPIKSFDNDGKLRMIGNFKNGMRHGLHKEFNDNGILISIFEYNRNKLRYNKTLYKRLVFNMYFDSTFHESGYSWIKEDFINHTDTSFYFNELGVLYRKTITKSSFFQNFEYWQNGKLRRKYSSIDNPFTHARNGDYIEYYDNGKIKVKGKYSIDGVPIGTWIVNEKNGKLKNKILFKRDTIISKDKDTVWTGYVMHNKFSSDITARNGWLRIGYWDASDRKFREGLSNNFESSLYPEWRPESIDNSNYDEFLNKYLENMDYEESIAHYQKMLILLDDYSIVNSSTPHKFESYTNE